MAVKKYEAWVYDKTMNSRNSDKCTINERWREAVTTQGIHERDGAGSRGKAKFQQRERHVLTQPQREDRRSSVQHSVLRTPALLQRKTMSHAGSCLR